MSSSNLLSRRRFASSLALAGSVFALPVLSAPEKIEKSKLTLAVDSKSALAYLPLTIADQLGFFRAEGLDVQISDFADATSASMAVVNGAADVCSGTFERTLYLQSKNQMFQSFVLQSRTPQVALGVSTRSLPAYGRVADLRGKKVGVAALDSMASITTHLHLMQGGFNAADVSFVQVSSWVNALEALRSGQIDALCNTDPVMTMLEQKGEVKIIQDTRTLKGTADLFGGNVPSACLYAASDFVQKMPNTCQALAHAMVHSLKWLQTAGPGDIIKTVPESYLLGDRALYLASFNKMRESISPDGMMPDDGPLTAFKAIGQYDAIFRAAKVNINKTYTNEFARRAKQRFRA
jgi:NitT/TauT family transport system substrate-binding protein